MAGTPTANMGLVAPASGDSDYPTTISTTFTTVDLHDHTTGKGVQIPTAGIANNAVTKAKLASLGQQVSATVTQLDTNVSAVVETTITGLSITITTTGRPVFVGLISDPATYSYIKILSQATGNSGVSVRLYRGATIISEQQIDLPITIVGGGGGTATHSMSVPVSTINHFDVPAAGTYTYSVKILGLNHLTNDVEFRSVKMFGYEL